MRYDQAGKLSSTGLYNVYSEKVYDKDGNFVNGYDENFKLVPGGNRDYNGTVITSNGKYIRRFETVGADGFTARERYENF